MRTAEQVDKGHGRRERRSIRTTTWLNGYLADWPGVQQVMRVERECVRGGRVSREVAYYITSLGRARADAGRLLALIRGHWGIENRLHHRRDVTLGEDACRVRTGAAPQVLAALRNAVLHLIDGTPARSAAAAQRRFAAHPDEALRLLIT